MKFANESMQAVVLIACDKHAPAVLEKVHQCPDGNWFVLPAAAGCRIGYWPHVSESHEGAGSAVMGFVESNTLGKCLQEFSSLNEDGSLCPDCVAYQWNITPSHIATNARDPVCGRSVACSDGLPFHHDGELFVFCSTGCRDQFQRDPARFVGIKQVA